MRGHYSNRMPGDHGMSSRSRVPKIVRDLHRLLVRSQESLAHDSVYLDGESIEELACVLVDFASDIRNDIGAALRSHIREGLLIGNWLAEPCSLLCLPKTPSALTLLDLWQIRVYSDSLCPMSSFAWPQTAGDRGA